MPANITDDAGPNRGIKDRRLRLMDQQLRRSRALDETRRERSPLHWATYGGDPWPEETRLEIESKDKSPAVSFNYTLSTVDTVLGDQMVNRREVEFKPVDLGKHDDVVAGWMTTIVRTLFTRCNGHRAESRAILDQLVTGMGWLHVYVDGSNIPPQMVVDFVPGNHMWHDGDATRDNLTDAGFVLREEVWYTDDAVAKWPLSSVAIRARSGTTEGEPFPTRHETFDDSHARGSTIPGRKDSVRVWEYQFRKREPWVAFLPMVPGAAGPDGSQKMVESDSLSHVTAADFDQMFRSEDQIQFVDLQGKPGAGPKTLPLSKFSKKLAKAPERYKETGRQEANRPSGFKKYPRWVYYRSVVLKAGAGHSAGKGVGDLEWLEKPVMMPFDSFNYIPVNGFWRSKPRSGSIEYFGLVEVIQPIQLLLAKVLTQSVQMLTRAVKGGGIIKQGILADPKNFEETQGQVGKWHLAKDKASLREDIYPWAAPTFPPFHAELVRMLQNAIPQITAVSEYLTGTARSERSNVLVTNLQGQAKTTLMPLTDPVESARVICGRVMMGIVQNFLPAMMIQQLLGEDGDIEDVTFEMVKDPEDPLAEPVRQEIASASDILKRRSVADFHIAIDTGEATVSEKQALMDVLGQILPMLTELPPAIMERMLPAFALSFPLPKGKAADLSEGLREDFEQARAMQTADGILEALGEMDIDQLIQIREQSDAIIAQATPPEEQAVQGPQPPGNGQPQAAA